MTSLLWGFASLFFAQGIPSGHLPTPVAMSQAYLFKSYFLKNLFFNFKEIVSILFYFCVFFSLISTSSQI